MPNAPTNPGWVYGYVPSPLQWAAAFSSKVDFPAPVSQGGTGAQTAPVAQYNLVQRQVLASGPLNLAAITDYWVRTSVGAFTYYLPTLASLQPGDWLNVADIDANANTNNVTITCQSSDLIAVYSNTPASSVTLNLAGVQVRFVANASNWRMLVLG